MSEHMYTSDHVRRWETAIRHLDQAKQELEATTLELANAEGAFAEHLAPDDMDIGEEIGVWVNVGFREEQMITVKRVNPKPGVAANYEIKRRGDVKHVGG